MKNTAKLIIFPDKTSFSVLIVKSCLIIRFFVVNIWVIRIFVVSLHRLKKNSAYEFKVRIKRKRSGTDRGYQELQAILPRWLSAIIMVCPAAF